MSSISGIADGLCMIGDPFANKHYVSLGCGNAPVSIAGGKRFAGQADDGMRLPSGILYKSSVGLPSLHHPTSGTQQSSTSPDPLLSTLSNMKLSIAVIIPVLSLLSRISAQCSLCPAKVFTGGGEAAPLIENLIFPFNGTLWRFCDYHNDLGSVTCTYDAVRTDSPPDP